MRQTSRRGILYVTAGFVVAGPIAIWFLSRLPAHAAEPVVIPVSFAAAPTPRTSALDEDGARADAAEGDLLALAQADPVALVERGWQWYQQRVEDYRCLLIKQERVQGELTDVEEVEVRYRKDPLSIYMIWHKNASQAKRALYKPFEDDFVNDEGEHLARIEPAGSVVRMFVKDIYLPINGAHARKASRRTIDECGFGPTFELFDKYTDMARAEGVLDIDFVGIGTVDGRPTFIIERRLPYEGEDGKYPDARLIVHLDQEWLLPVAVESYADAAGSKLLGRYAFTNVKLNLGLDEQDFAF